MHRIVYGIATLVVVLLATASPARGQATNGDAAVRAVVARYVAAREARDAAALSALFAEDADQLVSSGEWRRGRAAVVSGGLASSAQSSGVRTIDVETVRFATPDVAIADGRYDIAGTATTPARRMWTSFVLVRRNGAWLISAIRNMRPAE